jgi:hypothetical protein
VAMNDVETREFLEFVKNLSKGRWFGLPRMTTGEVIVRETPSAGGGAMEVFRVPKGESLGIAKESMIKAWAERDQGRKAVGGE